MTEGADLPGVAVAAAAAAAAMLGAARTPLKREGHEALQRLFPGCKYLAVGVGLVQPTANSGAASSKPLLLLGSTLLFGAAVHSSSLTAAAAVHLMHGSLAGSAILAGRPLTCGTTAAQACSGGGSGAVSAAGDWSDTAHAMQQCGAASFLCLPFRVAGVERERTWPEDAAAGSGSSGGPCSEESRRAAVVAVLLLGLAPLPPGQQQDQGQQQRQRQRAGSRPWAQHLRSLVQLAGALVRHAQGELLEAAEGLAVLQPAVPAAWPSSDREEARESSEAEGSDLETVGEEAPGEECSAAAAAASAGDAAAAGAPAAVTGSAPDGSGQSSVSDTAVEARELQAGAAMGGASALAACAQPRQRPEREQHGDGLGPRAPAGAGPGPGGIAPLPHLAACAHALLALCRALLAPLLQLLASRRDMQLDRLLRFQNAGQEDWDLSGTASPISHDGRGGSSAPGQQVWAQQAQRVLLGPEPLERQFMRYHARLMADKMDAAGCLILLSILVLLSKEATCRVRVGDPAFCAVAIVLALPLAALLPGAPRALYVRQREQLLQLFFLVVLIYQRAVHNFIDSHSSVASQARYVNAGYAWITVDGVLLQMRFCRQLPTLLVCFLLNLEAIPEVCALYHTHLDPRRCAASGFFRGVLCLLMPLAITYLLELRMRRNWLLRRQVEAAQADAEVQQALRTQRQQERQDARRARSAGAEAGSELH